MTGVAKLNCRTNTHKTKALTKTSTKILFGNLFLQLCLTTLKHKVTCLLKPHMWKHPTRAPSTHYHHFAEDVLAPNNNKNHSTLKHARITQTFVGTPAKHLGNGLLRGRSHTSGPFND